jgi:hypothetical protein
MRLTEEMLVDSGDARSQGLSELERSARSEEILNKVKFLMFAVWDGKPRCSRKDLSEFYEVSVSTIDSNRQRHSDEFKLDGVEVFEGQALQDARRIMRLPSKSSQETIFTAAGALRMGFILRDSEVAKAVRTMSIRVIQGVGSLVGLPDASLSLLKGKPEVAGLLDSGSPKLSAPVAPHYESVRRQLSRKYANGGISGFNVERFKEVFALLASYTNNWKLQTDKQLSHRSTGTTTYPHLTSDVFPVEASGQTLNGVILFHFCDPFVEHTDVIMADGTRRFIQAAKATPGVDLAWLFFVSPFGATPRALSYIENELREDSRGFVGVLLISELATFLKNQAYSERDANGMKGKLTSKFQEYGLTDYDIPDSPLLLLTNYQPDIPGLEGLK